MKITGIVLSLVVVGVVGLIADRAVRRVTGSATKPATKA